MSSNVLNGRTAEAQAFRAERVIQAATELASSGGYDAVQMREVARIAGVALATLYRYYPSKDDLLSAAINAQLVALREDVDRRPPRQRSPQGRASEVFMRAFRAMKHDRGFAHAAMSAYHVPLSLDSPPHGDWSNDFVDIAARAAWGANHKTTRREYRSLYMLQSLWTSSVIDWLNGHVTAEDVEERLRFATERLLDAGTAKGSPTSRRGAASPGLG